MVSGYEMPVMGSGGSGGIGESSSPEMPRYHWYVSGVVSLKLACAPTTNIVTLKPGYGEMESPGVSSPRKSESMMYGTLQFGLGVLLDQVTFLLARWPRLLMTSTWNVDDWDVG